MDEIREGLHGRFALTGEITLHLAGDIEANVSRIELTFQGSTASMESPLRLTIEGPLGELRRLEPVSPAIAKILGAVRGKPAEQEGKLTLEMKTPHVLAVTSAAKTTDEGDMQALLENVPFMTLLFELENYDVVSIGTIERG